MCLCVCVCLHVVYACAYMSVCVCVCDFFAFANNFTFVLLVLSLSFWWEYGLGDRTFSEPASAPDAVFCCCCCCFVLFVLFFYAPPTPLPLSLFQYFCSCFHFVCLCQWCLVASVNISTFTTNMVQILHAFSFLFFFLFFGGRGSIIQALESDPKWKLNIVLKHVFIVLRCLTGFTITLWHL